MYVFILRSTRVIGTGGCNGLPVAGEGRAGERVDAVQCGGARGDEGEYRMSGILEDINLTRQGEIKG